MEAFFFSITLDVANHLDYVAAGLTPNCTLRFSMWEYIPADFDNPASTLQMVSPDAVHSVVLTGGNAADAFSQRHILTHGFSTGSTSPCTTRARTTRARASRAPPARLPPPCAKERDRPRALAPGGQVPMAS